MPNAEFPVGSPRSRASRPSRSQNQDDRSIRQADGEDLETRRDRSPRLLPVSDAAAAYRLVYGRLDALIRGRAEVAELTVPACPAWNIRQTVAHLTGLALDIVSLNMEEKGLFRVSRGGAVWNWMALAVIGGCRPTVPGGVDSLVF
jgi:hypothetical protein